jgi:hypothetical protein
VAGNLEHNTVDGSDAAPPRKGYVAPALVEYGTVAKLTQTGGMTTIDFFFGLRRMGR